MRFRVSWPVLVIAGAFMLAMLPLYAADVARTFHIDFVAFWCGGSAILRGESPYLERGLHSCEIAHGLIPALTVPVPYPPYAFALFAAFAALPPAASYWLWSLLSIAAVASAAIELQRLSGVHWSVTGASLCSLVLIPSLPLGQAVPLALLGFVWALVAIARERYAWAAIGLAGAALVPSFALPAWIAAFIAVPRLRLPLVAAGVSLAAVSTLVTGPQNALAYVTHVVAAHGASETTAFWQLGWSAILHVAGLSAAQALAGAIAVEAIAIATGVAIGLRLAARFGGPQWVVATATAFGVAGAPFVHGLDLSFALPLTLMVLGAQPAQTLPRVALVAMSVPWPHLFADTGIQAAIVLAPLFVVSDAATGGRLLFSAALTAAIALGGETIYRVSGDATVQAEAAAAMRVYALPYDALAEERWRAFTQALPSRAIDWYQRAPTYAALAASLLAAIRALRRA